MAAFGLVAYSVLDSRDRDSNPDEDPDYDYEHEYRRVIGLWVKPAFGMNLDHEQES